MPYLLPKASPVDTITLRFGFNTGIVWWGHKHSVHNSGPGI